MAGGRVEPGWMACGSALLMDHAVVQRDAQFGGNLVILYGHLGLGLGRDNDVLDVLAV